MKTIDLTHSLSETTIVHPEKTPFSRKVIDKGAHLNDISLSSGIGTHMDAPRHFYPEGRTIDQIEITEFCGKASVLHLHEKVKDNPDYEILADDITEWESQHGEIPKGNIVLVHTGWDRYWGEKRFCFQDDGGQSHFPGFSKGAAELIVKRSVKGVGIDTMGIDPGFRKECLAHFVFLKKDLFLVENLANLGKLPPNGAFVYIFPMKIENAPEAPVRAVAFLGGRFH